MWQVPVFRFELRTCRCRPRHLAARWIDFPKASDLMAKRLNHRRSIRLVLDQLQISVRPFLRQPPDGRQRSRQVQLIANLIQ